MKFDSSVYKNITLISQLGISMLTPILMCVFLGRFLEERYGWPVFVPLLIMGILAGGRNVYQLAMSTVDTKGKVDEDE